MIEFIPDFRIYSTFQNLFPIFLFFGQVSKSRLLCRVYEIFNLSFSLFQKPSLNTSTTTGRIISWLFLPPQAHLKQKQFLRTCRSLIKNNRILECVALIWNMANYLVSNMILCHSGKQQSFRMELVLKREIERQRERRAKDFILRSSPSTVRSFTKRRPCWGVGVHTRHHHVNLQLFWIRR